MEGRNNPGMDALNTEWASEVQKAKMISRIALNCGKKNKKWEDDPEQTGAILDLS